MYPAGVDSVQGLLSSARIIITLLGVDCYVRYRTSGVDSRTVLSDSSLQTSTHI